MLRTELSVNGQACAVEAEARTTLLDGLRDELGLNGVHAGCEHGVCGACTVLLDGVPVRACLILACQADGFAITTIEGLAPAPGELSVVQDAFWETHGLQCGYCTPAMILTAHAFLLTNPSPTRDEIVEAISGNICRCTGYGQIVEAIALAAERLRGRNEVESGNSLPPPRGEGRVGEADRGGGHAGGAAASSYTPPTHNPSPRGGGERVGGPAPVSPTETVE